ncbi:MAG: filamentous hemagglutinin N-terminal domain-containing protein, partial [Richelia sp. RM2_1_2]|nr:filamentous hemagglutinin N-terminal domain-containing protein [Richelia sp. RM2_1_2]
VVPNNNIQNVLTRVTGNNPSEILGILGTISNRNFDPSNANLFLINPNGIVFGENATLDINGSFVGTTANGIEFGEQGFFSATNPETTPLLTVNPSAFLFSQIKQTASIQNNSVAPTGIIDPAGFNVFGLRVPDGKSLLLLGGNVNMNSGELNAYGGRVELGGLAETGTVALDINGNNFSLGFPDNVTRADVSLTNQAKVYVEANGGGDIVFNAGNVEITGGSFLSGGIGEGLGTPETVAGDITLNATGEITVADSSIFNEVRRDSRGNGGNITVNAGSFNLAEGAALAASTFGEGKAGNVTLTAKDTISLTDANIFSTVEAGGVGNGGNITVNAANLTLRDGAQLLTSTREAFGTQSAGKGDAGSVIIEANGFVKFDGEDKDGFSSGVFSTVEDEAVGKAGNIFIKAGGDISTGILNSSSSSSSGNAGNGGAISLNAGGDIFVKETRIETSLSFLSVATLNSSSSSDSGNAGNGGAISLNAGGDIVDSTGATILDSSSLSFRGNAGNGGAITLNAGGDISTFNKLSNPPFRGILRSSSSSDSGNARDGGGIILNAGGNIFTYNLKSSSSSDSGNARDGGAISLKAGGSIFANKLDSSSLSFKGNAGNGGTINLFARNNDIAGDENTIGMQLVSFALSEEQNGGRGGDITLKTKGSIRDLRILTESSNSISGTVQLTGSENLEIANTKIITSRQLSITEDSGIGAISNQPVDVSEKGQSGNVNITSNGNLTFNNSSIESDTKGENPAGNVNITSPGLIIFNNSTIVNDSNSTGDAGSINVSADRGITFTDSNSGIFARTSAEGKAGSITVNTPELTLSDQAQITATATKTATNTEGGGNITLNASKIDLAGIVGVFAETQGESPAGTLTLQPDNNKPNLDLTLALGAKISASTSGSGNGGDLLMSAPEAINISGQGKLAVETTGTGDAGNIEIDTQKLTLSDGVEISASTESSGKAGNITLNVSEDITASGSGTGIFAITIEGSRGQGGNIIIDPITMTIRDGAKIAVDSQGEGTGGNVQLAAGLLTLDNGQISAETRTNTGGDINLNLEDLLLLRNGSKISTTAGNEQFGGDGGNIIINTPFIVAFPKENSDITANAFTGTGGEVKINSQGIFGIEPRTQQTAQSDITASSQLGVSGNVNLTTPDNSDIQNSLIELLENPIDSEALIASSCVVR